MNYNEEMCYIFYYLRYFFNLLFNFLNNFNRYIVIQMRVVILFHINILDHFIIIMLLYYVCYYIIISCIMGAL